MSWIAGLADKAENILNKIDQNAATALQINENSPVTSLKKSLSSNTLKTTFSPMKTSGQYQLSSSVSSVKSDVVPTVFTESINSQDKLEWNIGSSMTSSRRSSISSKGEIAIEMPFGETAKAELEKPIEKTLSQPNATLSGQYPSTSSEKQELIAFKIALNEVSQERDELRLRLNALNHDIDNVGLKQNIEQLENLVQQLTIERDQVQQELYESRNTGNVYVHSISELESNLAKMQQEYLDVVHKLQMQTKETELTHHELQEYRTKAQLALQMKDGIIAELKAKSGNVTPENTITEYNVGTDLSQLKLEFNVLNEKYQHLLMEHQTLSLHLEESRRDVIEIKQRHAEVTSKLDSMRKDLRLERERVISAESEQRVLEQELSTLRQQLSDQMSASAKQLQQRENQIQMLKKSSNNQPNGEDEALGYESRIRVLTQALVDKQNAMEGISAERNALRIQLEKLQDELGRVNNQKSISLGTPRNALLSNSTDDAKAQFPLLLRENPFDNRVARRVKRAYSSLDSAGIRLGVFLRRYPLMRIFVLMYIGLLHIWVMFVLLSSTPNS